MRCITTYDHEKDAKNSGPTVGTAARVFFAMNVYLRKIGLYQHTKSRGQMQRRLPLLFSILLAGLIGLNLTSPLHAQQNYPGGFTLMPLEPGPVRLLSLIVDASVRDDGNQAIAEVQAVFRVHNTNKAKPQTLTVALPGYAVPKPPPDAISLSVGGKELPMTPGFTQWWLAEIELKPDQRRNIVLTYTMPLGDTPFVQFRYPLDLTAQLWPGVLASSRFTLAFSEPPNPQSWLRLTPETYQLTAESITWSYDGEDPKEPIDYIFMRPSFWQRLRAARQAAVATNAPASAKIALGDIYTDLAVNSADTHLINLDANTIFERYFPLAVAAYSQAQSADPDSPTSYLALARLYRTKAEHTQPPDASYISLAVNQLAGALEHGANDPAIATAVSQDFATLIARARLEGDYDTANTYLQRLENLAANSQISLESEALARERKQLAIDWITSILQNEGPAPARAVFTENFGDTSILPSFARFAQINSLYVEVNTEPEHRTIRIIAAPRQNSEPILQQLYEALLATNVAYVVIEETQPPAIRLDIPFETASDLQIKEQTLALAIPSEPEWSLLSSILQPQTLRWDKTPEGWRTIDTYREDINLVAAVSQLSTEADVLSAAADSLASDDPLDALRADIWRAEAEVWRRLAENNRARFTLIMKPRPGAPVQRTWSLDPGERVQMTGRVVQYDIMPFVYAALGLYGVFVLSTWSLWRFQQRRQGRPTSQIKRGTN
ncbi:MAG: hypothetical protein GXP38_15580 [Chloroflexi bacterium]|nr:hypothetical protein [Chloroflexota bacterium]